MKRLTRRLKGDSFRHQSSSRIRFDVHKGVEHGFPHRPSTLAYDETLRLLFLGTKTGSIRVYGRPGVLYAGTHDGDTAVLQILPHGEKCQFVTSCLDNYLYLWQLSDEKKPNLEIVKKYRLASSSSFGGAKAISVCCLPVGSPFLYVGTESGNLYTLLVEGLCLQDRTVVYWNHATAGLQSYTKLHPGAIEALQAHPSHPNKILIGFEKGAIVLWNFQTKRPEQAFSPLQYLECLCWHPEGKQFITSHSDGSFAVYNANHPGAPEKSIPYGPTACKRIEKILWRGTDSDPLVVFSGGMPRVNHGDKHCVTVMQGASHVALDFSSKVIDFTCVYERGEPTALLVLTEEELVAFDLTTIGIPEIPKPYLHSLHDSPVTFLTHCANVPEGLWADLKQLSSLRRAKENWPILGGSIIETDKEVSRDLVITGHENGSICFWDASHVCLRPLHRVNLSGLFYPPMQDPPTVHKQNDQDDKEEEEKEGEGREEEEEEEVKWPPFRRAGSFDPFCDDQRLTVVELAFCPLTKVLAVGSYGGFVVVTSLDLREREALLPTVDVCYAPSTHSLKSAASQPLMCRSSSLQLKPGFQPSLFVSCRPVMPISKLKLSCDWGLLAIASNRGIALVDYFQKQLVQVKSTTNEDVPDRSLSRFQSLRKSIRNSFRRLRIQTPHQQQESSKREGGEGHHPSSSLPPSRQPKRERRVTADTLGSTLERKERRNGVKSAHFSETFAYGPSSFPSLWAGTMSGHVLSFHIYIPNMAHRHADTVTAEQTAKEYHLHHGAPVIQIVTLDHGGRTIAGQFARADKRVVAPDMNPPHYGVVVSEEQIKVILLPSYKHKFKQKLSDVNADAESFRQATVVKSPSGDEYLACLTAKGELLMFSLPDVRLLHKHQLINPDDGRAIHRFVFTSNGQAFYMSSPSQIQRVTLHPNAAGVQTHCLLLEERVKQHEANHFVPTNKTGEGRVPGQLKSNGDTSHPGSSDIPVFDEAALEKGARNSSQYSSSQSPEGSLDDDAMQEVSIDAAVRAQTWSRLSKGSAEERVDAVNSKKNFTDGSISNGSDESAAAAKPPRPRNPMDQREKLQERKEKLIDIASASARQEQSASKFADNVAALVEQHEKKPWWKL